MRNIVISIAILPDQESAVMRYVVEKGKYISAMVAGVLDVKCKNTLKGDCIYPDDRGKTKICCIIPFSL